MWQDSGALIDLLAADGRILACDPRQEAALGHAAGALAGQDWAAVYPLAARERLAAALAAADAAPTVLSLDLRRADGGRVAVTAVAEAVGDPAHGACLRLYKWPRGGALDDLATLAEEREVIAGIVAASDDAGWCMEWAEPVDLSAPVHEIIRQVFENGPRWRFCNAAMARLYQAPEGADFNALPVADTFPRSPENEEFIATLIRANFDTNGSPSRDRRYDGTYIEVENDVRSHIRGNRLFRMWGTVRDVSKHMRRAQLLAEEIRALQSLLDAVPDAFLVTDRGGSILHANLAVGQIVGNSDLSAANLSDFLELPRGLDDLFSAANASPFGRLRQPFAAVVTRGDGPVRVEGSARIFGLRGSDCLALTLRIVPGRTEAAATLEVIHGGRR